MKTRDRMVVVQLVALAIGTLLGGCGGPARAKPVDPEMARTTLRKVLDHWKSGGKPEDLQAESPQVIVNDFDWPLGARLTEYEILGDGEARDANLFCNVKLTLADAENNTEEKTVTYCVGTDPKLTVIRGFP